MPQLDPATYTSQIFWLAVTFLGLTLLLWRVALPRISATLENRQQRIDNDIARAGELAKEAEGVMAAYEAEVSKARAEAQEELHRAALTAAAEAEQRNTALTETLSQDASAARKRIDEARAAAVSNVSEIAADISRQAVERLIGETPEGGEITTAVDAAVQERV